jgi:hypothetical protein
MNKQNKQRFQELHLKLKLEEYPSFKDKINCIPPANTKESGSNDLTRLVVTWLQMNGWQAERISSQGQYRDNTKVVTDVLGRKRSIGSKQWTKGQSTAGTADISATIHGMSIKIEIKWEDDRQSDKQKEYQNNVKKAGGIYILIKTFDDFIIWYELFLKTKEMKTYKAKNGKLFRLAQITQEKHGYSCVIFWIDSEKYETHPFQLIESYLM